MSIVESATKERTDNSLATSKELRKGNIKGNEVKDIDANSYSSFTKGDAVLIVAGAIGLLVLGFGLASHFGLLAKFAATAHWVPNMAQVTHLTASQFNILTMVAGSAITGGAIVGEGIKHRESIKEFVKEKLSSSDEGAELP